jgi:hypothetical protein
VREMKKNPKYIVCDEEGPLRVFYTKQEALKWMGHRPEFELNTLVKEKEPSVFEITPEAVF